MDKTLGQYDRIIEKCKEIFLAKTADYGTAWRILRLPSLTDQLYIKASRIRSIEEKGAQKVEEPTENEFIGLVNYSFIALIQLSLSEKDPIELPLEQVSLLYDREAKTTRDLLAAKNHDYGEIWREMRVSSLTDIILMKLLRVKQIEDNKGKTLVSEGLDANYRDIVNYAVFALIKLSD
ncbi:MAG: DUF1599 domain-containing protein [Saprospirales bacterium]|nr:DUF1599 domain-containing protein [Saprospirales bacterium]